MFPQLPVQPSTEFTRNDTLHSDPMLFFDRTCHKTHSQTNRHPPSTIIAAADNHSLLPFASLELVSSPPPSEKQWDHYFSFLEEHVLSEQEHDANVYVNLLFALGQHIIQTGAQTAEGGWRRRILGFCMDGAFFDCSEFVVVANKSKKKKGKKKKREGGKGNEEEVKIPLDGISAAAGMMIRKSASDGRLPKRVRDTVYLRFFSILSNACSAALLERREGGNEVEGVYGGKPDAYLKVLQSIVSIREELDTYKVKPLVEGMVESDAGRADN